MLHRARSIGAPAHALAWQHGLGLHVGSCVEDLMTAPRAHVGKGGRGISIGNE